MPMNPRLLRPKALGVPVFTEKGYTRLWGLTNKSGAAAGSASTDSGHYAVKWWDGTTDVYDSGDPFTKSGSGTRAFEIYPAIPGTTLLLPLDGANGATSTTDSSSFGHSITFNGDAEISTTQSKFGGSSLYCPSTGGWLSVPANSGLNLGTGDFTIEMWAYLPQQAVQYPTLFANGTVWYGPGDEFNLMWDGNYGAGQLVIELANSLYGATTVDPDEWHHIAIVRKGNTWKMFCDGVASTPWTFSGPIDLAYNSGALQIGNGWNGVDSYLDGYIDDFHVVKGVALYTANFTPPTSPATAVPPPPAGAITVETSLLLNLNGSNGATSTTDASSYGHAITFNGDAEISTTQSKFGGSSLLLDGASYVSAAYDASLDLNSGDFTVEAWFRPASTSGFQSVVSVWDGGSGSASYILGVDGGTPTVYWGTNVSTPTVSGGTVNAGQWHHLALTRSGATMRLFCDGILEDSATVTDAASGSVGLTIGKYNINNGGAGAADGYIDDIRIVKGKALYTANFTPPTVQLSVYGPETRYTAKFTGFDVSDNSLVQLRAEQVTLDTSEQGDLSNNDLSAVALDQFYTDLDSGTGDLFVQGNPGIVDADQTIATGKGYTVFPSTTLLLHFDGSNGATSTTDDSPEGHAITLNGDAEISTTQSKFGGSSGKFTLTGGTLTVPYSAALEFGAGDDFTVELWARFESLGSYRDIVGTHTATLPIGWLLQTNGTDLRFFKNSGGTVDIAWGVTLSTGTWYHIAFARQAGTLRCFLDGVLATSQSVSVALTSAEGLAIGRAGYIDGYIDDLRIVKGAALYTANFTPPTGPLTVYP